MSESHRQKGGRLNMGDVDLVPPDYVEETPVVLGPIEKQIRAIVREELLALLADSAVIERIAKALATQAQTILTSSTKVGADPLRGPRPS